MTRFNIPLTSGAAYQEFTTDVNQRRLTFRVRWLVLYKFFAVDIYENGEPLTLGRGLHPNVDLLRIPVSDNADTLRLEGAAPSLSNLGTANRLIYTVAQ